MMRAFAACAALLALLGAAPIAQATDPGVPVLMYHKIDPNTPASAVGKSLTLEPSAFDAQLAWLRAHHIRTLTMDELANDLKRGEHPQHAVVLTFDDGYSDAAVYATPILVKYGDRASFYVSAGFIGDGRHADWRQLRAMRAAGMEIGCHGTHHYDLSLMTRAAAGREIGACVDTLARFLARPTTYAYPAGRFNAATLQIMRSEGMKAALTEHPGIVTSLTTPYTLPRRRIDRSTGPAGFAALATP